MSTDAPPYDCMICGACCSSPWTGEGYVWLYEEDAERLGRLGLPLVQPPAEMEGEPFAKLGTRLDAQGRRVCAALGGAVGQACPCTIYEARPALCRQFPAGSLQCREARRRVGLPV